MPGGQASLRLRGTLSPCCERGRVARMRRIGAPLRTLSRGQLAVLLVSLLGASAALGTYALRQKHIAVMVGFCTVVLLICVHSFVSQMHQRRALSAMRDAQLNLKKVERLVSRAEWRNGQLHGAAAASLSRIRDSLRAGDHQAEFDEVLTLLRSTRARPRTPVDVDLQTTRITERDIERLLVRFMRDRAIDGGADA